MFLTSFSLFTGHVGTRSRRRVVDQAYYQGLPWVTLKDYYVNFIDKNILNTDRTLTPISDI